VAVAHTAVVTAPARVSWLKSSRVGRRLVSNRSVVVAFAFLVMLVLVATLAPVLTPKDPSAQSLANSLEGPSGQYWLGTDRLGRDRLSRLIMGTRVNLVAAFQGVGIAALLGIPAGLAAGYFGRKAGAVLNFVAEVFMSMPPLILALSIVGIRGAGLTNAMIAIGIILAPRMFRVARASAIAVRNETYIEAARCGGSRARRILARHVLPNSSGPLLVQASFAVGLAAVAEASLSFLGLGVQEPDASWGSMIRDAYQTMHATSFPIFPPTILLVLTVLAFATLGDGLRDALGETHEEADL
jgi:peptide/nickel transport system permease protein